MVFLCVAAFLLHIVLNRLIGTQRVNIATLKAFGYQHRRIAIHYLLFALIATVTGVVLGLLTGRWMGSAYTGMYAEIFRFPSLPFTIDWVSFAVAAGISILAGLLGAAGALRAVVRLEAAEGMNPAPPARYRPLILERWRLQHLLSPVQRMVMRNVERRPARAFLASVGVGAGLAVLLVGLNILDAVVEMVNLQFANMQREDVTVVFRTEQPRRAYREVARIESVQHVEPFWSVPVRFTHNQHTRRIAITGITEDSKLRRLLDRQGGRHPLPLAGIVMTDRLASVLQLAVGDTVSVARLDRSGVDWQSTISGHTDEIAGLNAYLVDTDMQRVLREDRRVSGAYLKVERGKELNVVRRLQDIPDVIGVYSKATALRAFEKQLAESLRITFTILFILGGVLASGVVYNTTRIALSERSHELATLRVLGFSGREIGNMLLGEQAVIVAAALPLGAALGAFVSMIIIRAFETEYYRVPFVMTWHSVLLASLAIVAVAALSGAVVKRKLMRLDLIAALKVR
ncbi:MAG TPA: FtsX-like permease family protein, partial [Longimicrobiales bacterium]